MSYKEFMITKRNGKQTSFDQTKIFRAIELAFLSNGNQDPTLVASLTNEVLTKLNQSKQQSFNVEIIQDIVEETLMEHGLLKIAKNYILYRERQTQKDKVMFFLKLKTEN